MKMRLLVLGLVLAALATASLLPPIGIPVRSGDTILTSLDAGGRTVLLLTSVNPAVTRFIVEYTVKQESHMALAERHGSTVQNLATVIIDAPYVGISNVTVQGIGNTPPPDPF